VQRSRGLLLLSQFVIALTRSGRPFYYCADIVFSQILQCFLRHLHQSYIACAYDQHIRSGLDDLLQVVFIQPVALLAPPSWAYSSGQDDQIGGVGPAIDADLAKGMGKPPSPSLRLSLVRRALSASGEHCPLRARLGRASASPVSLAAATASL
jgi:hypothetical protein